MKRAICAGLRQAIFSRGFIISTVGTAIILLLSSVQGILAGFRSAELLSPGYHSDLIMGALSSDAMARALPILAALPYTASFIDDVKSGFIKEYLPRITEPFYMVDKSRSKKQGGVGLGLAIVQRIASAHGAALTAESVPGEFTSIKIVFQAK
ncbi:MAG: ATP-binding protein [Christensenellales bacterium]|jgi:hypothetical protein